MKFSWKWASVIAVLALGIVGSFAVAAPKGGGAGSSAGSGTTEDRGRGVVVFAGPGHDPSDLAKELGVSSADLRDALDAVHDDLGPPGMPAPGERPSRADLEKRCTELTDALGSKLNKSGDEVRAAIKKVAKADIEQAVKDKRLSRARADKILARLDSAKCLPPLGPHGGPGCGGPGLRHRDGDRDRGRFAPGAFPGRAGPPAEAPAASGTRL
jgi:hypothetical protein